MTYNKTFDTSLTVTGNVADANAYKDEIAKDLGVGRDIPTRVGANLGFGSNAYIYRELASAVDSIEQAQDRDSKLNMWRGMKTPSLDVAAASKELVEKCRQHLKDIDTHPTLDDEDKKKQRQEVFDILETIRIANAREKTWKWTKEFYASLGKNIRDNINESIKWPNILSNLFKIGVCVAVFVVASMFLGPAAPIVMPLMFLALSAYCAVRIYQGISAAWKTADQAASKEKKEAAKDVLAMAAEGAKNISEETKAARETAKNDMDAQKIIYDNEKKAFDDNEKLIVQENEIQTKIKFYDMIIDPKVKKEGDITDLEAKKIYNEFLKDGDVKAKTGKTTPGFADVQNYIKSHAKVAESGKLLALGKPSNNKVGLETSMKNAKKLFDDKQKIYTDLEVHVTTAKEAEDRVKRADPSNMSLKAKLKAAIPSSSTVVPVASPISSAGTSPKKSP